MSTKSKMFSRRNKALALAKVRRSYVISNLVDREIAKMQYKLNHLSIEEKKNARKNGIILTESPIKLHKLLIK